MVFVRSWNFDVAARLLSSTDLAQVLDPESDFGAAIAAALEGIEVTANLPSGGNTGQLLKKASNANGDVAWGSLAVADITGLQAALDAKADQSAVDGFTAALANKADSSTVTTLTTTVNGKASQAALDSLATTVSGKADQSGVDALTLLDLADVSDTALADGQVHMYDDGAGEMLPTTLQGLFGEADPNTQQLLQSAAAPHTLFGFIIEEGQNPPAGLPLGLGVPIVGFEKVAPPSLVPTLLDDNFAQTASAVVLTMPQTLDVGDKLLIVVGVSGEVTVPDNFLLTPQSGSLGTPTWTTLENPNTTAAVRMATVDVTGTINSGQTLTITSRISTTAESVAHLLAAAFLTQNLAASPHDQVAVDTDGSSTGTMTAVQTATTGALAQPNELCIGAAVWNSSTTATRTLAGTNGYQELSQQKSQAAGGARSLFVAYKVVSSTAGVNFTTLMTASDNTTGQHCAQLLTLKGAP